VLDRVPCGKQTKRQIQTVPVTVPGRYYEGLRLRQEMDCQKLQGADRAECTGKSGMSYDEYQRQLKEREGSCIGMTSNLLLLYLPSHEY